MTKSFARPDWYTSANPDALLIDAGVRRADYHGVLDAESLPVPRARRARLFGCACARTVWDLLSTDAQNAVVLSERLADGRTTETALQAAGVRMTYGPVTFQQHAANAAGWASAGYWEAVGRSGYFWNPIEASREASKALATRAAGPAPPGGSPVSKQWETAYNRASSRARAHQAELIRDIFPPPGYSPGLSRDWRTSTVVALARQMDETGDFSAVPILADALQDAGCDDDIVLGRCRAPSGVHCRGNWVVDLVLGRE